MNTRQNCSIQVCILVYIYRDMIGHSVLFFISLQHPCVDIQVTIQFKMPLEGIGSSSGGRPMP